MKLWAYARFSGVWNRIRFQQRRMPEYFNGVSLLRDKATNLTLINPTIKMSAESDIRYGLPIHEALNTTLDDHLAADAAPKIGKHGLVFHHAASPFDGVGPSTPRGAGAVCKLELWIHAQ